MFIGYCALVDVCCRLCFLIAVGWLCLVVCCSLLGVGCSLFVARCLCYIGCWLLCVVLFDIRIVLLVVRHVFFFVVVVVVCLWLVDRCVD